VRLVRGDPGVLRGVDDGEAADADDAGDGEVAEEFDDGVIERVGEDSVGPGGLVLHVDGGEVVEGALFAVEELHDAHAGDVLLREGVDLCGGGALAAIAVADFVAEFLCCEDDEGENGERDQREYPAHGKHDADDEGQREYVFEDGEDAGGEHFVERVDVRGDARDETADGVAIEEGDVQALDVAENLRAQVEHDLLAGPLHEVGLDELQAPTSGECAEVEQRELGDAVHGRRGKFMGEPAAVWDGLEVGVDRDFDEVGAGDIADGFEEDCERGYSRCQLVGQQVAEEAAGKLRVIHFAYYVIFMAGAFGRLLL
jgi:hypothetical protein